MAEPKATLAAALKHQKILRKDFEDATADVRVYLRIVMQNNPKTLDEALQRPDVQYVLQQAAVEAWNRMQDSLDKAALAGGLTGHSIAEKSLESKSSFLFTPGDVLDALRGDLQNLVQDIVPQASAAFMTGDPDQLQKTFDKLAVRAQFIGEAAVKWHSSLAQIAAMKNSGTAAMWKTTSLEPCSFCKKLEGQVRNWGQPFTVVGFPVYGGAPLLGPQLHPNCRCILVPVSLAKAKLEK